MADKNPLLDLQAEIAKAQLRKLDLEISALETDVKVRESTVDEEQEKLLLEISSLRRQNGLLSRVTQFATVLTVLATMTTILVSIFSLWSGYDKFITDKKKDTELRAQQVTEETNKQYRAELQQLLQFPTRTDDTIPIAEFLLRDIQEVIEAGYKDDPDTLSRRSREVGFLLSQLIKSPEFSLNKPRNSEFDRKALAYSTYYADYLAATPSDTLDILSKYKTELVNLRNEDPTYVSTTAVKGNNIFVNQSEPKSALVQSQLQSLFLGYKKHVDVLANSAEKQPEDTDIKAKLNLAFCWFYGATGNRNLTSTIFRSDPAIVQELWDHECT